MGGWAQGVLTPAFPPPPPSGGQRQPAHTSVAPPSGGQFESNTMLQGMDRVFDTDSDSIDFEEGVMNWKGRSFAFGDNRVMRARFERYLSSPLPASDVNAYAALLDRINRRLSVSNIELSADGLRDVWEVLFDASSFDVDGGNSLIIANQVFNAWRVRDERAVDRLTQRELEEQRRVQQQIVANRAAFVARAEREAQRAEQRRTSTAGGRGSSVGGGEASSGQLATEAQFRVTDLAETEAKLRAMDTSAATTGVQSKLQFQTQILAFMAQRRFEHALIAINFYRLIFKGSAQELEVGRREWSDLLGSTEASPTVTSLEFIAREAINDVRTGIASVESSFERGEWLNALQRLQETYFLGEHMIPVVSFDPAKKEALHAFYRDLREVRQLFDLKDFERVDALAQSLAARARDFQSSQILSASGSAQRLSDLSLLAAQQALGAQQFDRAEQSLGRATSLWPMNPRIRDFTESMVQRVDGRGNAVIDFDKLMASRSFRSIYDARAELGVALVSDAQRAALLKQVVESVGRIDMLLLQAKEMEAQGNPFGAWEALLAASAFDGDDVLLNRAKANLAPRAAVFVGHLDRARELEARGALPAGLTRFLAAQDVYPASQEARLGIERLGLALMQDLRSRQPVEE